MEDLGITSLSGVWAEYLALDSFDPLEDTVVLRFTYDSTNSRACSDCLYLISTRNAVRLNMILEEEIERWGKACDTPRVPPLSTQ